MHNSEFEKRMEHKLEELKFTPSDAVWQKVEVQIRERKRRRRFFFWWLPAIILCTGTGTWLIYLQERVTDKSPGVTVVKETEQPSSVNVNTSQSVIPVPEKNAVSEEKNKLVEKENNTVLKKITPSAIVKLKEDRGVNVAVHRIEKHKTTAAKEHSDQPIVKEKEQAIPEITSSATVIPNPVIVNDPVAVVNEPVKKKKQEETVTVKQEDQVETKKPIVTDNPVNSKAETHAAVKKSNEKVNQKLQFAVTVKAGITDVSKFSEGFNKSNRVYSPPAASNGGGTSVPSKDSLRVTAGTGFAAGVQVTRSLTNRSSLSAGIAYAYYSASHKTGNTVYAAAQFNNSVANTSVSSYARLGDIAAYNDRYHFIEIPVLVQLQLNKPQNRPLLFDAGIAFNYLVSSNAQYYYSTTSAYYYDRKLFNRSQLQLRSGFSIGLIKKKSYPLQAGLQYQYNLSGLWKNSLDLNQHLSFTGIQLSWRLNNK